ncbi:alkylhydroperoxidase AhpD family core domain-containing protein [Chitinophaga terrae (ex Kim and Jung 2007)]|uniref:Alkylhydroperoxidase AhpD family core domain-containing protein n=1 Tax=Chitinophaga terrae (ex Kim and Jung 2007) TaxID=408074 RepID=A0A1H4FWQ1_9BACT|nr:carboxymuconolactone decarboxylase family protein [Chitinophaga terrae (ex Kim and Jung 2007)]GEP92758.1 hypothetical protein CTE07_44030 [Chitinophaga terrae (ex Kim and Jung 2007)]SEB01783.1 alkylhydroperoxidase AhpD family core domain-containing protein [Chitinophaga terrae (ex Kim and Jung 2007)]
MQARINFMELPKAFSDGLFRLGGYVKKSGLDPILLELINFRISTINGCAFCLDMHYKDAIALGEDPQRLYSLSAWRECPYYTDAERAVLAYAEEVNTLHVTDETYEEISRFFNKQQIADITLAVAAINTWNRLNRAFLTVPGGYQVGQFA